MGPLLYVAVNALDVLSTATYHAHLARSSLSVAQLCSRCYSPARSASTATTSSGQSTSPTSLTESPANLDTTAASKFTAPRPNTLPTQIQIEQQRLRSRGGQNLTARWSRLERSLRGKEGYEARRDTLIEQADHASADAERSAASEKAPRTFLGLVLPEKPKEPQSDECCMSGCAICVYDLYTAALEDYKHALDALRTALQARKVPEREWPVEVKGEDEAAGGTLPKSPQNVAFSAFEELERSLRARREREASGSPG
ncbi:uncharacterized protein B0H18DRAFT_1034830 [Fomitopsis serialis]|uniref:uncharacterized protein n=1 Tax=Fomitopsis serialis TaxID=139415 RepID=UPI002007D0AE|nr:uncharacterized protein B0H18DRAFT_1034830 [Neoantrodia serialis]KAH9917299.1 hypothetical protein B0H18DRAFT_1034830 [Neoantrodia serialis]